MHFKGIEMKVLSLFGLSFVTSCVLFANPALTQKEINQSKEYLEKLPKYDMSNDGITPEILKEKSREIKVNELMDSYNTNKEKFQADFKSVEFNTNNPFANKQAKEVDSFAKSKQFQGLVEQNKEHLLYDKSIDWSKYVGKYKSKIEELKNKGIDNKYLLKDEKIFIVISSSMPKETIRNYFKALENVNTDITFILRGIVGNDISKINPTLHYISDLLLKDKNGKLDDINNHYAFKVDINPKVTRKFNITKAPAVIYIQNYDFMLEQQQELGQVKSDEKYYISYGASDINYTLQEINKKAKSKGLDTIIKKMNEGFYKK